MGDTASLGEWIRRRRKALDLTREALAQQVGCAIITIRKIEADERRPSRQITERLAECLQIPLGDRAAFMQAARAELAVDRIAMPPAPPLSPPPTPRRPAERAPQQRALKGYELQEQLGAGGFGAVYRAVQPGVGREVAAKIIRPEFANHPDFIRRFGAEAQLVARLEHPYIVPLYDYWRESGGAYLVMRYMRGGSLHAALRAGSWPLGRAARLLDQVGAALAFAHRHGVVHRDIKPANILLDEESNAYLADFGIAKDLGIAQQVGETQPGAVIGSPAYLSPEQVRDEPATTRSDIYSLGVLLYEVLAGSHPFGDLPPAERLYKQLNEPLPLLNAQRADLPAAADAIIQRATAKAPAERYPDVASMVVDWQRMVTTESRRSTIDETAIDIGPSSTLHPPSPESQTLTDLAALKNPYKGLRAFSEADAADFFGRDALTQRLLERLAAEDIEARFLAVVGPSGSGKSSAVRAGLVPALRRGALPGSEHWFVAEILPGAHPLEELEATLLRIAVNPPEHLLGQLQEDHRGLARAVKRVLPADSEAELVLVIDQFEEVFTLVEDEATRTHLLDSLLAAVSDPRSRLRVIVTLRADFYDRPLLYPRFGELMRARTEVVLPLAAEELERAIIGPAARVGVTAEASLVATIVQEVGEQPGALPLLQYALTELFQRREGRLLTLAAYRESGGVQGALARRAEELYARLDARAQEAVRQLFLRLVTPGEGVEGTRRRVRLDELATTDQRPATNEATDSEWSAVGGRQSSGIDVAIEAYGRRRLLTFDRDPVTRQPTVEVAHEALIRAWGRLRAWLDAGREEVRVQRQLARAAAEWVSAGHDPSYLATGARLAQFAVLAEAGGLALNQDERAFLATSRERAEREQVEREAQRRRELAAAQQLAEEQGRAAAQLRKRALYLAGALVVALTMAGAALFFSERSRRGALEAQEVSRVATSRELAASAISSLDRDPERSILLALQAVTTTYALDHTVLPEAEQALHEAVQASHLQLTFADETSWMMTVAFSPDRTRIATISAEGTAKVRDATTGNVLLTIPGHTPGNESLAHQRLAFSPDGARLATCANDTVTVWDAVSGQALLTISNQSNEVGSVAFSPDGLRLATGSQDGTVKLWVATTGKELLTLAGHTYQIEGLAFSPDGTRLASGSGDVKVWDVATGKPLLTLTSYNSFVTSVAYSPDGTRLAAASGSALVSIWDASSGKLLNQFAPRDGPNTVTFSPDGTRLATGNWGGTTSILDAATGKELATLAGHTERVYSVVFSPDGTHLATASLDKTARVWDITAGRGLLTFSYTAPVNRVVFSPDGTRLVVGVDDGTVNVWDARTGQAVHTLSGHAAGIYGVAFSRDGARIAAARVDSTANVWEAASGKLLLTLAGHTDWVRGVAFSPDGMHIATASFDQTAIVWDAMSGEKLLTLAGHGSLAMSVAYSPDGARIAVPYQDGTAKVWDAASGKELFTLSGHTAAIWAIAYSSDGARIATASVDGTAKIWDAATGKVLLTLSGHTGQVWSVAFNADGTRIATASEDKTAKVWDVATGKLLHTLPGHAAGIYGVAFSPDGTHIATASSDGTARIYLLRLEELIALAQSRVTRSLTTEECQQYLHQAQCPVMP
jgi:WD40 repeat protein/serine/threonine protein kinase/DNA-binding XRE family transcriptional regulator